MLTFSLASHPAKSAKSIGATRQKERRHSKDACGGHAEAASEALHIKRELAAALLIGNRNAVLIGTDIVFFGQQDGSPAILPLSMTPHTPAPAVKAWRESRIA